MNYVIKHFIEETGQLTVDFDGHVFSIDVPLNQDDLYVTGEELDAYIKGFAPTDYINRNNKIAVGIANSAEIKALETEPLPSPTQGSSDVEEVQAVQIENHVKAALIKLGVIPV